MHLRRRSLSCCCRGQLSCSFDGRPHWGRNLEVFHATATPRTLENSVACTAPLQRAWYFWISACNLTGSELSGPTSKTMDNLTSVHPCTTILKVEDNFHWHQSRATYTLYA